MKAFDSLPECEEYLEGTPVLSLFGQVTKVRFGKLKRRLILDVRQSRVKEGTRKVHRVPLPRATDVVYDIMDMLHKLPLGTDEQLDLLVLDFVDAFWNVPLMASERRFFVGKLRSRYFAFIRAAQGSRRGPLAWAWCHLQFDLCKLVCGKVVSVLRGSTPTSTTHSQWCEALRLEEITLSRA